MSRNIVSSHELRALDMKSLQSIFLENETESPFSRSLSPTEDFHVEFDKNILASSNRIFIISAFFGTIHSIKFQNIAEIINIFIK